MDTAMFSYGKRAIFPKVKENKRLRGGVVVYAAQAKVRTDAAMGEKGRFRMKTSSLPREKSDIPVKKLTPPQQTDDSAKSKKGPKGNSELAARPFD
jgi:hypothetical protein